MAQIRQISESERKFVMHGFIFTFTQLREIFSIMKSKHLWWKTYTGTQTLAPCPLELFNFCSWHKVRACRTRIILQTHQLLTILQQLLLPREVSQETKKKEREHVLDPSPTWIPGQLRRLKIFPIPILAFSHLGRHRRLPATPKWPIAQLRRSRSLPCPRAAAFPKQHPGLSRARLGEPPSHCARGEYRRRQGAPGPAPRDRTARSAAARPPPAFRGPRDANAAPEARGAGLAPEPAAQAGAMLKTKMAAPGKGAQLRPWGAAPLPAPPPGDVALPAGPRAGTVPVPGDRPGIRDPPAPLSRAAPLPPPARGPEPPEPISAPRGVRPGPVPAARPVPPPSAPAPSRSEPTRAGCSAGSPGWCSAAAGTARRGPPPPAHPGPRGPAAAAALRRRLRPPRSSRPAAGSRYPRSAAGAAAASARPPSRRLLRLRGARPLSAGSPPSRPAAGAWNRDRGGGERRRLGRAGGGGPATGRRGAAPSGIRVSEQRRAATSRHYSLPAVGPPTRCRAGREGGAARRARPAGKSLPSPLRFFVPARRDGGARMRLWEVSAVPGGGGAGLRGGGVRPSRRRCRCGRVARRRALSGGFVRPLRLRLAGLCSGLPGGVRFASQVGDSRLGWLSVLWRCPMLIVL